ncbi:diguanylate cyclase [Catellatospora sp. KI3]|uniref:sensor domain-containing diguanylate cyclase n=1 Tax=Catellatospora sp. KI3 TaxID=3041620 RepID=UPI0024826D50|nr:diguanylate cyclase [Catellatospora sp. KI3]MDI1465170.1 diguanylate cyclase [Catellatospora sp. KI3]
MSADVMTGEDAVPGDEPPHKRARHRAWLAYAALSAALLACYAAADGHRLAQAVVFALANLAAVLAILIGIRLHRPARRAPWYLLAAGQAAYLLGNLHWYVAAAVADRPPVFPSPAVEAFLLSYLLNTLALLQLIRARRARGDWSALLDALIVTIAFTAVNFTVVVAPMLNTTELAPKAQLLAGVYPFLDMIFLVLAARLFFGAQDARGSLTALAAWAAVLLLADMAYGLQQVQGTESEADAPFYGYLLSYLFVGVAALQPGMRDLTTRRERAHAAGRVRLAALALCGLAVPALVIDSVRHAELVEPIVLACASALMFLLLMLRVGDLLAKAVSTGRREQARLQQFLEAVPIGVSVRTADTGEPVYANQVAGRILGYDPGEVASPEELPDAYISGTGEPYTPERLPLVQARQGRTASVDDLEVEVDGRRRRLKVVATPIRDGDTISYIVVAISDITTERRMAEELRRLSSVDELTGVDNRRGFLLAARTELTRAQSARRPAVLLFIDLDGLKAINDTYGHSAGDDAIRTTARLLRANTRRHDVLGRIGGDEFCVLLTEASTAADAGLWARRLREQVDRHNDSAGQPYRLAVTVGVSVFDHDSSATLEELIDHADAAMYQARELDDRQGPKGPVRIHGLPRVTHERRRSGC